MWIVLCCIVNLWMVRVKSLTLAVNHVEYIYNNVSGIILCRTTPNESIFLLDKMADKRHLPLVTAELCTLGGYFYLTVIDAFKRFPLRHHVSSIVVNSAVDLVCSHLVWNTRTCEKLGRGLQGNSWHTVSTQQGFPWFAQFDVDIYCKSPPDVLYFQPDNYAFFNLSLWQLGFPSAKQIFSVIFIIFFIVL